MAKMQKSLQKPPWWLHVNPVDLCTSLQSRRIDLLEYHVEEKTGDDGEAPQVDVDKSCALVTPDFGVGKDFCFETTPGRKR